MANQAWIRGGHRYLGNLNTKEVHDLRNEQPQCQIDKILKAGHAVHFDLPPLNATRGNVRIFAL